MNLPRGFRGRGSAADYPLYIILQALTIPDGFPLRVVLQALGSPRQFDYVADLMVNLQVVSFIYSRATSLKGCKVSEAQLRRETLLRLLLPLNDQV